MFTPLFFSSCFCFLFSLQLRAAIQSLFVMYFIFCLFSPISGIVIFRLILNRFFFFLLFFFSWFSFHVHFVLCIQTNKRERERERKRKHTVHCGIIWNLFILCLHAHSVFGYCVCFFLFVRRSLLPSTSVMQRVCVYISVCSNQIRIRKKRRKTESTRASSTTKWKKKKQNKPRNMCNKWAKAEKIMNSIIGNLEYNALVFAKKNILRKKKTHTTHRRADQQMKMAWNSFDKRKTTKKSNKLNREDEENLKTKKKKEKKKWKCTHNNILVQNCEGNPNPSRERKNNRKMNLQNKTKRTRNIFLAEVCVV